MSSISSPNNPFTVGVALTGAGWHPAAWREADAQPHRLFHADYWQQLVATAADGEADYVTIEDSLALPSSSALGGTAVPPTPQPDTVDARLDALLLLSWIAPLTARIGVIPSVTVTHTEPFHVATALQTLDFISEGRAGWQARISAGVAEAAAFGRRPAPQVDAAKVIAAEPDTGLDDLLAEAADVFEVVRGLSDSWEDDAIIRDRATGRFLDRDRLHHVNFEGERFSVAGPSIVPRSPQGQLPLTLLAHSRPLYELAARTSDVVFITPDADSLRAGASHGKSTAEIVAEVRAAEAAVDRAGRGLAPLRIVADLVVALDDSSEQGAARLARLGELHGTPFESDAAILAGSVTEVADRISRWHEAGIDGVRIRPLTQPHDLRTVTAELLPELRRRGLAGAAQTHSETPAPTLRERFGLGTAVNRYATPAQPAAAPANAELLEAAR